MIATQSSSSVAIRDRLRLVSALLMRARYLRPAEYPRNVESAEVKACMDAAGRLNDVYLSERAIIDVLKTFRREGAHDISFGALVDGSGDLHSEDDVTIGELLDHLLSCDRKSEGDSHGR